MDKAIHGSCLCGAVRFRIEGPFSAFQYCHCSRCRKHTGSAHAANIFVPVGQFEWEQGEDQVRRFELPSAKYWSCGFCTTCGSSLPWLSKTGKAVIVPAGSLDDDPGERPQRNVYFGSRAPWYEHASELDTYDTFPKK